MNGVNPVAFSSLPTTMPLYEPLEPEFSYDLDRARELLAEAGYADGVDLTMATTTLVPNQLQIDQAIDMQGPGDLASLYEGAGDSWEVK